MSYPRRMRHLTAVVLALFLAVVGTAASAERATTYVPIAVESGLWANGSVDAGDGSNGVLVRFFPKRRFAVGMVLRNRADRAVVVTRARLIEPRRTLLHQTGARFHPYAPPDCSPYIYGCPGTSFDIGSGAAHHPQPFRIAAGKYVGVELDLREGSCSSVRTARGRPITRLRVTYHKVGRPTRHGVLVLHEALRLRMPKPAECRFPHSKLFVNGAGATGTNYIFTIPGSPGDVCTRNGHTLTFRSRAMQNSLSRPERIELRVPGFAGVGTYRAATASIVSDGKTAYDSPAIVTVAKATSHVVLGRLRAGRIHGWMRCRVRG